MAGRVKQKNRLHRNVLLTDGIKNLTCHSMERKKGRVRGAKGEMVFAIHGSRIEIKLLKYFWRLASLPCRFQELEAESTLTDHDKYREKGCPRRLTDMKQWMNPRQVLFLLIWQARALRTHTIVFNTSTVIPSV